MPKKHDIVIFMNQEDVLKVMRREMRPMTARDIGELLEADINRVRDKLRNLERWQCVEIFDKLPPHRTGGCSIWRYTLTKKYLEMERR